VKNVARSVTLVVLIVGGRQGIARADPFTLTSGDVDYESSGVGNFQLVSGRPPSVDFFLSGGLDAARGGRFDAAECFTGCAPGSILSLAANWTGSEIDASAVVHGVQYDSANATLALAGSVRLPPASLSGGLDTEAVDAPFTLTGSLDLPSGQAGAFSTVGFTGAGTARVFLTPSANGWSVSSVFYDVVPTPEPTTILLLGSGLVAAHARKFWRGRTRNS